MRAYRTILHPTDFSGCSTAALEVASTLAREHGARLVCLHVVPAIEALHSRERVTLEDPDSSRATLEELRGRLEGTGLQAVETRLASGEAASEILRTARETGAELIVLGTHGHSGLRRLLLGSVAEEVLQHAGCMVLVVKDPETCAAPKPA